MADLRIIMRDNRISGTPVVEDGRLVGMISIEDLINALLNNDIDAPIREKMTTKVECFYADEPLVHTFAKFSKYGHSRYPVLERDGRLAGIITKGNVVQGLLKKARDRIRDHRGETGLIPAGPAHDPEVL